MITTGRTILYLQSQQNMSSLPACYANLTAINLSSFHFGYSDSDETPYIHLNDNTPENPMYASLWKEMSTAQSKGVLLIAMLGGAGGAYTELFNDYTTFYPLLVQTLKKYDFDGVDLDVEETVTSENIEKLIADLRKDFPTNFYITAAPVCEALKTGDDPFAGIDWFPLRKQIDWFNVQFYSGYGTLSSVSDYQDIIAQGYNPDQIVGGSLTNPSDGGGYVAIATVAATLQSLNTQYKGIGGAMGWEYFNSLDSSEKVDPAGWCKTMKAAVTPASVTA